MKWLALAGTALCALLALFMLHDSSADAPGAVASEAQAPATDHACTDWDGDGYGIGCSDGADCNDRDATIHPGQVEACNFRDDDCNALVDDVAACVAPPIERTPVQVGAGRFAMGSEDGADDEKPMHDVQVAAFVLDRHEITNARYQACVEAGVCTKPALASSARRQQYFGMPAFADYPVIFVDWGQANAYCGFAGGRLPTEAEWEKAARGAAPSVATYPWGNTAPDCSLANMGGPQGCAADTDRIGRRTAGQSPYGALDMAGNVWEWVGDWYDPDYYASSPAADPQGPADGRLKVMRGGCWESGADSLRASCRKAELPSTWAYNVGFRCAYPVED